MSQSTTIRRALQVTICIFWVSLFASPAASQDYGTRLGSVNRGGEVNFEPTGPGVLFDALDPSVRKWYVPQELYNEYGWRQAEYTNYARRRYERYVDTAIEGDYFYDQYGSFVTRGWLVYDWQEDRPQQFGSTILKTSRYRNWFNRVVIASDSKGQYHYTLTIGDEIRTTLTPMTFSKPGFNGIQFDFGADKYQGTLLLSRPSRPAQVTEPEVPDTRTSVTNLLGGRGEMQVGDFIKLGATYVSAFQAQTLRDDVAGTPFSGGSLTTEQNAVPVAKIILRLSDDSPEDGIGGAALFDDEIVITDVDGNVVRGSDIGFEPVREGGFQKVGYLAADGGERILLTYDFTDPSYLGPDRSVIKEVAFELVLSNDYLVEITSDRQTNEDQQPVFLLSERAAGNIQDNSNQRLLRIEYGLPTSNVVFGFTIEGTQVFGFDFYGEYDFNKRYRKYPNVNRKNHSTAVDDAQAWMLNVTRTTYPWFLSFEGYSMDSDYSTRSFLAGTRVQDEIDYENERLYVYEFVEDNDDQDRRPDWDRFGQNLIDTAIFPGYDENNDFISDFNQNDTDDRPNLVPDYEEPFLRYHTDRPEFLFGIDMNNNGWIDRFENDNEPDYPYKRDRRGYNSYVGLHLMSDARLTVGRTDEDLIDGDGTNRTTYLMLTLDRDRANLGRLRFYQYLRKAKDNIPDHLFQWVQRPDSRGGLVDIQDPLPARDTWINTTYLRFDYKAVENFNFVNKLKYEIFHQSDNVSELRETSSFFGLINKADYTLQFGPVDVQPRWKSEFVRQRPVEERDPARRELTETLFLVTRFPILRHTLVELGLEISHFEQMRDKKGVPVNRALLPDSNSRVFAMQFRNSSPYLGYNLELRTGLRLQKQTFETLPSETTSTLFVTVYAGLGG
ncbi:MAG: hypothetical protein HOM68_27000 [Gemmatimonadetes bacterium]|jgi:hypothetical protein|nr:hypothetical protein [Gemmatimonadota bacterium]MBT5146435.1 hypothetical protein [Gemmatimonadota bacterium]MBT5591356.1 hypothetical protein [Gemmatimonadota bacterium]MBT5962189.1 hypothetical protein [Gemmatimonadota bacterium]MBT6628952.1 hypothetical protein [Gemmatimonadota bacterium]